MSFDILDIKSIAVIGASRYKEKLGYWVLKNIISGGFEGKIYPVNPKAKKIQNLPSYSSVKEIPGNVDLAVIIVPAVIVPLVLKESVEKKVKLVVIISAGFSETGPEGKKLEDQLKEIIKDKKTRVIGPNCLGLILPYQKINATFAPKLPRVGHIGFISQSGALATALLDWTEKSEVGFSAFVSLGNKIDIGENEALLWLKDDKNSKSIGIYLESFQNGKEFIKIVSSITPLKPILVLKSGKTKEGATAVSSHTGSMVGSVESTSAALLKSGVLEAQSIKDFFKLIVSFSVGKELKNGAKIAILTNAGGPGILTTDALVKADLELANFTNETKEKLRIVLPSIASFANPLDISGDAKAERYKNALEILTHDPKIDIIIIILTPQVVTQVKETAEVISQIAKKTEKLIFTSFMGGKKVKPGVLILKKNRIPGFTYPEEVIEVVKRLVLYHKAKKKIKEFALKKNEIEISKKNILEIKKIIEKNKIEKRVFIDYKDSFEILKILGIKTPKTEKVKSLANALYFWRKIKKPVALKASSDEIIHKVDKKAIYLNLNSFIKLIIAYKSLKKLQAPIFIQEMAKEGVEIIIGAKRDNEFGHIVIFGWGGIYTEVIRDINYGIAPLSIPEAKYLIEGTRVYELLTGFRGKERCNVNDLILTLAKISQLVYNFPEICELDLNPIFVSKKGAIAIDIRIKLL